MHADPNAAPDPAGTLVFPGSRLRAPAGQVFQLVNLPVEFDASRRARRMLVDHGIITQQEDAVVKKVLRAAAMTYVAATLTAILTLVYYLLRAGLLGGRRH